MTDALSPGTPSPFEQIRRVNDAGSEYWFSRILTQIFVRKHFFKFSISELQRFP